MPKNKAINLLPQEEFSASTTGRVLKWATGTFRIIVILTEMVVMGAFLSRFWLDAQNSNLNNSIKIKSAQISAQTDLENRFRSVQSKLIIFDSISSSNNTTILLDKIIAVVPQNLTLSRVLISDGVAEIHGTSVSDSNINQFISGLQKDPTFKSVDLKQINSSTNSIGQTDFMVNLTY